MKSLTFAALLTLVSVSQATNPIHARHAHNVHKRQAPSGSSASAPSSGSASSPSATGTNRPSQSGNSAPTVPTPAGNYPPGLATITFGMPTQQTLPVTATYSPGQSPPYSGAPPLPSAFVFQTGKWPAQDKIPDTTSPEVQGWMKELEGFNIPNLEPTVDGTCKSSPEAAADAENRGWWSCGGYIRDTDVVACPDKYTWGVSFDDGPSRQTTKLLKYLDEEKIKTTFFVVGSRVIEFPQILIDEYMTGHEISVHTWSHKPLTSLTNEQIVAELGWTRKAIKEVLGITPTTMRPPFGDIDDRVRAITLAMGMEPIMWTRAPSSGSFDTFDWSVAAGQATGVEAYQKFQSILQEASHLDTGFIVLQHDLYEITVDLATDYFIPAALEFTPKLKLEPIWQCLKRPTTDLYLETTTNQTFPFKNSTARNGSSAAGDNGAPSALPVSFASLGGLLFVALLGALL